MEVQIVNDRIFEVQHDNICLMDRRVILDLGAMLRGNIDEKVKPN